MKKIILSLGLILLTSACGGSNTSMPVADHQSNAKVPNNEQPKPEDFLKKANGIEVSDLEKYLQDDFKIYAYSMNGSKDVLDGAPIIFNSDGTIDTLKASPLFTYTLKPYHYNEFFGLNSCTITAAPEGALMYFSGPNQSFFVSNLEIKWEVIETAFNPLLKITQSFTRYPSCRPDDCNKKELYCIGFDPTPTPTENTKSYIIEDANESGLTLQTYYDYYIVLLK